MRRLLLLFALCSCGASSPPPSEPLAPPVTGGDARCLTFPTCTVTTTCPGTTTCIAVKSCAEPICATSEKACALQCGGVGSCSLLESYPLQIACAQ